MTTLTLYLNSRDRNLEKYQSPVDFIIQSESYSNSNRTEYIINAFQTPTYELLNLKDVKISGNYITNYTLEKKVGGGTSDTDFTSLQDTGCINSYGKGNLSNINLDGVSNPKSILPYLKQITSENTDNSNFKSSSTINDYYKGLQIFLYKENSKSDYSDHDHTESSEIIRYIGANDQINPCLGKYNCILNDPLTDIYDYWSIGIGLKTHLQKNNIINSNYVFVPNGSDINDFYKGKYLIPIDSMNINDKSKIREIKSYDGKTKLAYFEDFDFDVNVKLGCRFKIVSYIPEYVGYGCIDSLRPMSYNEQRQDTNDFHAAQRDICENGWGKIDTGSGRLCSKFGIYKFKITNPGTGFEKKVLFSKRMNPIPNSVGYSANNLTSLRCAIKVTDLDSNGGIKEAEIAYPGFFPEHVVGKKFQILSPQSDKQGELAEIEVTKTAAVFDLTPSYNNQLSTDTNRLTIESNSYKNKLLYIPSLYEGEISNTNKQNGVHPDYHNINDNDKENKAMFKILKHTYFSADQCNYGVINNLNKFSKNMRLDPANDNSYNTDDPNTSPGNICELGKGANYFKPSNVDLTGAGFLLVENVTNTVSLDELKDTTTIFKSKPKRDDIEITANWNQQYSTYWDVSYKGSDSSSFSNYCWTYEDYSCGCSNSMINFFADMLWIRDGLNFEILPNLVTTQNYNLDYRTLLHNYTTKYMCKLDTITIPSNLYNTLKNSNVPYFFLKITTNSPSKSNNMISSSKIDNAFQVLLDKTVNNTDTYYTLRDCTDSNVILLLNTNSQIRIQLLDKDGKLVNNEIGEISTCFKLTEIK